MSVVTTARASERRFGGRFRVQIHIYIYILTATMKANVHFFVQDTLGLVFGHDDYKWSLLYVFVRQGE